MYFVKYGETYLHDPRDMNLLLIDLSLECEENSSGFCDFTIYPNHNLYNRIKAHDLNNKIKVYDDNTVIFTGFIYEINNGLQLEKKVKCKGELAYLNESIIRPYFREFTTIRSFLTWIINEHNTQVDPPKRFTIGYIEDMVTDIKMEYSNGYVTTLDAITSNILDNAQIGGYLSLEENTISYHRYHNVKSSQTIKLGVNLIDYSLTDDYEEINTYIIPTGCKMSESDQPYDENSKDNDMTLSLLPDGPVAGYSDFVKKGDYIYSKSAVESYGKIGGTYSNTNITKLNDLLSEGVAVLRSMMSPKRTIEIKAVDMHLLNSGVKPMKIGEYVKVISEPHGLNDYFLCTSISLDLENPENSVYTFGKKPETFTSSIKKAVNDVADADAESDSGSGSGSDGDGDGDGDSDDNKRLVEIWVKMGSSKPNDIEFVYEKVTSDSSDDGYIGPDYGDSGSSGDINIDYGESSGGTTDEEQYTSESYACEYDSEGKIIRFGSIDIIWM